MNYFECFLFLLLSLAFSTFSIDAQITLINIIFFFFFFPPSYRRKTIFFNANGVNTFLHVNNSNDNSNYINIYICKLHRTKKQMRVKNNYLNFFTAVSLKESEQNLVTVPCNNNNYNNVK